MRSTTAPGTIGTGEPCSLPGRPCPLRGGGWPGFLVLLLSRLLSVLPVISICCPVRARSEPSAGADRGLYTNQGPARWQGDRGGGRPRTDRYQRS
jgi:hypothetical protein